MPFYALLFQFILVFAIGGSVRADAAQLVLLRPASVLVLACGLFTLRWEHVRKYAGLFGFAFAFVLIGVFQLIPLPPAVVHAAPGHELIGEIDRVTGHAARWRPLSMVPTATRNALWAMIPPICVLVLAVQLADNERKRLLGLLLGIGVVSAVVGMLQLSSDAAEFLYFYVPASYGMPVGLFANRNHQAAFLATLIPTLAAWLNVRRSGRGSSSRSEVVMVWATGLLFFIYIFVTGSRAGLLTGIIASCLLPWLTADAGATAGKGSAGVNRRKLAAALVLAGIAFVVMAIAGGRAIALSRLLATDPMDEIRVQIVPVDVRMIRDFWPWGSGLGSFDSVFRMYEPDILLQQTYMNHAHNDWLEWILTTGALGVAVGFAILAWLCRCIFIVVRPATSRPCLVMARLGIIVLGLLGFASLSDYPARVPSLICWMTFACVLVARGSAAKTSSAARVAKA
ncbi:MAG: O-antigen ligase family protein [Sphingomonadales bacterium]|nr:O-antigen ligase family protein [Sphingomonadales bacterium]